jgi:hypothetical protein
LALEPTEIDQLVKDLKARHPIREDFTAPESETQADGTEISYETPDAKAVEKYKSEAYPQWINACRAVFESLHKGRIELEPQVTLAFGVTNGGTRPASKMRLSFEAKGDFHLSRKSNKPDEDKNRDDVSFSTPPKPKLPLPPVAPEVQRKVKPPLLVSKGVDITTLRRSAFEKAPREGTGFLASLSAINNPDSIIGNIQRIGLPAESARNMGLFSDAIRMSERYDHFNRSLIETARDAEFSRYDIPSIRLQALPKKENPESFYYVDWKPQKTTKLGALTCQLFRHGREEELFDVDIIFPVEGNVKGAVLCKAEAENLTHPKEYPIKVSRRIVTYSLEVIAKEMIEHCGS